MEALQPKLSGRQIAEQNVELLQAWIKTRDEAGDWADYVRANKLNRVEVARECGFAKSALQQNPTIKQLLASLEERLQQDGVLFGQAQDSGMEHVEKPADPDSEIALNMALRAKAVAQQRVKTVEEQNATLRAEIKELKDRLRKSSMVDQHLAQTGRLLTQ